MKSYISVEVSIPIEHDGGVNQADLEAEGFGFVYQVLSAVSAWAAESELTSPEFPGRVDVHGIRAALAAVHRGGVNGEA